MNISNIMGSADTSVVAASKKNKWKLTDSLKDKIAEMAKKDAQNNEYMGNEFKSLRKSEISKVAPDRAALIGTRPCCGTRRAVQLQRRHRFDARQSF